MSTFTTRSGIMNTKMGIILMMIILLDQFTSINTQSTRQFRNNDDDDDMLHAALANQIQEISHELHTQKAWINEQQNEKGKSEMSTTH